MNQRGVDVDMSRFYDRYRVLVRAPDCYYETRCCRSWDEIEPLVREGLARVRAGALYCTFSRGFITATRTERMSVSETLPGVEEFVRRCKETFDLAFKED